MSTLDILDSTSAAGAMLKRPVRGPVLVVSMLAGSSTSAEALPLHVPLSLPAEQTSAGTAVAPTQPSGAAIGELRRLSGLTWEQLARLFDVSRRSLHFWASGRPIGPSNEERLQRLLSVVRQLDRGSAGANRALLLGVSKDGTLPFDLLAAGEYERVLSLLGSGEARRVAPPKPSKEARALRAPRPPEELVGALQDRIHPTSGRVRGAKTIAIRSRK